VYIPRHFREDDLATLEDMIRAYPFATVVSQLDGKLAASHVPLTLDPTQGGEYGTLYGHLARGNTQWQTFDGTQEALVMFQGPHAYVSASWYEAPATTVPTWNYAVVHAYGVARPVEHAALLDHLTRLAQLLEASSERPWSFERSDPRIEQLSRGIVGFAVPITRLEGKFKLSQNRSQEDQARVIDHLRAATDTTARDVAALMRERLHEREGQDEGERE
jgi:transcriptional regulator